MALGWVHHVKHFVCKLKLANCEATNKRITEAANEMLSKKAHISFVIYITNRLLLSIFGGIQRIPTSSGRMKTSEIAYYRCVYKLNNERNWKKIFLFDILYLNRLKISVSKDPKNLLRSMNVHSKRNFNINIPLPFSVACVCIKFHLLVFITIAIVYTLSFNNFVHGSNHTF